jgi:hypothetical protein
MVLIVGGLLGAAGARGADPRTSSMQNAEVERRRNCGSSTLAAGAESAAATSLLKESLHEWAEDVSATLSKRIYLSGLRWSRLQMVMAAASGLVGVAAATVVAAASSVPLGTAQLAPFLLQLNRGQRFRCCQ